MIPQHPDNWSEDWKPRKGSDIGQAFDKIKETIIPKYRGERHSEREGKFWFMGKPFSTLGEIKSEIDRMLDETERQFPNILKP